MTPVNGAVSSNLGEADGRVALAVLRDVAAGHEIIPPGVHARIRDGLQSTRLGSPYAEAVASLEAAAGTLAVLSQAHRAARFDHHLSQLARLRRR